MSENESWLDRPLGAMLRLDGEKALYGLLIALALLSRLWDLGLRVFSHDETVHAQWAWYLYKGQGYAHTPLSHGPFLFHANALSFYLFGDSDFSARLVPALLGVLLVALPYTMRRWLGRRGALVTAGLFLISPSVLYYSRYARNDVPIVVWTLLFFLALLRYLEATADRARARWLIVLAASLALMFATKEVAFIYVAILGLGLVGLCFGRLGWPGRPTAAKAGWRGIALSVLGLLGVLLATVGLLLFSLGIVGLFPIRYQDCGGAPLPGTTGQMTCAEAGCTFIGGRCQRPLPVVVGGAAAEFDATGARVALRLTSLEVVIALLLIGGVTLLAGWGAHAVLDRFMPFRWSERPALDLILAVGSFTLPFLSPLLTSGASRLVSHWIFGIDVGFDALDYSDAGLLRSVGFVLIVLAVGSAVGWWWGRRRWLVAAGVFYAIFLVLFTTVFTNGNGLASGMVGSLGYWLEQQAVERGGQPLYYYALLVPLYEYLPLLGCAAALLYVLRARARRHSAFIYLVLFWVALSWPAYSIAGERMPWLMVHLVAPMILASGWLAERLIAGTDWRALWRRGGWVGALIAPLGLAALVQTLSPWLGVLGARPFAGRGLGQWNVTLQFAAAAAVLAIAGWALRGVWRQIGVQGLGRVLAALGIGLLVALTVRTAWALAYLNFDDAGEFMVFAHGSPGVRALMARVEALSRHTSGHRSLDVAYTHEGAYPFLWYLRNYPNAVPLSSSPGRADLDKSVLIVFDGEWPKVEPYLGDGYACQRYDRLWWPMEDYKRLDWDRVRYALFSPEMRAAVWDILFRRDYRRYERASGKTVRPSEWPLHDGARLCVRRDVLAGAWGLDVAAVSPVPDVGATSDAYVPDDAALEQSLAAELTVDVGGAWGGLNHPHGVALDAARGYVYLADTDNHRIVKCSTAGRVVDVWASTWWRGRETWQSSGCLDQTGRSLASGDGEFCEPWGVAVGPDGTVYVADTWNHRVQAFSPEGEFLAKVGRFGQSGGTVTAAPGQFYGPRDVAVDQGGRVYVSDTGNKRVQVFDADMNHLYAFGGPGIVEGRLDEPVGVALGPDGLLYVADTWNRRVQAFTSQGDFVRAWPVPGWTGQSVFNKPYVAVDGAGRVYVSDPERQRVRVFDALGAPLAVLRGDQGVAWSSPAGLALDAQDRLWLSDAVDNRLVRFSAINSVSRPGSQ